MRIEEYEFGRLHDGKPVPEFLLSNDEGLEIRLISLGAAIRSVRMPDRSGKIDELTLGFDSLERYLDPHPYFGSTVGRFANRIDGARFQLDGKIFELAANDGPNHLHGGIRGFHLAMWSAEPFTRGGSIGVAFTYRSKDGEEGYPGNLSVTTTYTLTSASELEFEYRATTDRKTPINLTNHTYWNLSGAGSGPVFDHVLAIDADRYLPVNENRIPTGERRPVEGTPFDFRTEKRIDRDFSEVPGGYDHCYVVNGRHGTMRKAAAVMDPKSGRSMEVYTTQPGIQFYSSNMLGTTRGANGRTFERHGALCLETQNFPNAVNETEFPSPWLSPGETYREVTMHRFSLS